MTKDSQYGLLARLIGGKIEAVTKTYDIDDNVYYGLAIGGFIEGKRVRFDLIMLSDMEGNAPGGFEVQIDGELVV